ncbi:hypothetical protein FOMPIDRAFT_1060770 [Fomitopsis schrenkii]|uniref:Uncharacterized protein n=1 Tax=Fomitopsis schrenkii TaxID=2126942 RepID=S8E324_FOMSC|nr:hypothetical protein FOMPIDRAFT_1060770 [Fomitopsis schrenkii]
MHSVGKTSNQQSCTTINRGRTVRIQVTQAKVERPLSKDDSSGSAAHGGRGHASCSTDPHLVISPTRPLSPRIPWNCGDERAAAVRVPSRTWTLTANNRVTTGTRRAGTVARHRAVFLVPWRSAACLARVVGDDTDFRTGGTTRPHRRPCVRRDCLAERQAHALRTHRAPSVAD